MDLFQKCYDFKAVDEAKTVGIYPYCPVVSSRQGATTIMNGKETIMVGSSNYLGLSGDERVIQAAKNALDKFGTGCTGTRLFNGTTELHIELETKLAEFVSKEAVTVFPTGFQSNVAIIPALAQANDIIFSDSANHESILTGNKVSTAECQEFPHNDLSSLERMLMESDPQKGKLIIVDGVFSFDGTLADIPALVRLKNKYNARLMVDDSHGFGVMGKTGRGTCEYFGLMDQVDIYMATFSKCFSSVGGFVASNKQVVNYISHIAGAYTNTAALPPVNVATVLECLDILEKEPELAEKAKENAEYVRSELIARGVPCVRGAISPIVSFYTKDEITTYLYAVQLLQKGVYVNVLVSNGLIRTCYNAKHTHNQLNYVADQIAAVALQ